MHTEAQQGLQEKEDLESHPLASDLSPSCNESELDELVLWGAA